MVYLATSLPIMILSSLAILEGVMETIGYKLTLEHSLPSTNRWIDRGCQPLFGNMLWRVIAEFSKPWDTLFSQVKFAYNSFINHLTRKTPFSIVYTKALNHLIDLTILPRKKNSAACSMATYFTKLTEVI